MYTVETVQGAWEDNSLDAIASRMAEYYANQYFPVVTSIMSPDETDLPAQEVSDFYSKTRQMSEDNYSRTDAQKAWDVGCDRYHNGRDA